MKPAALVGILLLVVGIAGLAAGHISFTTKEKVVDLGPIQVSADKKHTIPLPELASGAALLVGVILIGMGMRKA